MVEDFGLFLRENKLILPKQPSHDDFLNVMQKMFHLSCFFGVCGSKKYTSCIWSFFLLCALLYIEAMAIWKVIKAVGGWAIDIQGNRSVAARFAGTLFYTISILSMFFASRLSYSWKNISALWSKVERTMSLKVPTDKTLKRRMYVMAGFLLTGSFLEHVMSVISVIDFDFPLELILKQYVMLTHGFMILKHEYSELYAIPLLFLGTIATFLWNFQDLLIVLVSIGLTSRYSRLNQYLIRVCTQEKNKIEGDKKTNSLSVYTWRKLREAYVKQAMLVRKMDQALGGIILLSCMYNFYFICLQLFMGITQGPVSTPIRRAYFFVSLGWLCIRVFSVVHTASEINVHSQQALKYIYTYDTQAYNVEVERLQDQLTKDFVALSGMGFFYLNKTILLQMAASIITYELVLIQFDDGTAIADNNQLNITGV